MRGIFYDKRDGSHLLAEKPRCKSVDFSLSNYCLGACLSPYRALFNLQTRERSGFSNPGGCCI